MQHLVLFLCVLFTLGSSVYSKVRIDSPDSCSMNTISCKVFCGVALRRSALTTTNRRLSNMQALRGLEGTENSEVITKPCILYHRVTHYSDRPPEYTWECELDAADGQAFVVAPENIDLSGAVSGDTTLFAEEINVINDQMVIETPSTAVFGNSGRRSRHLEVSGTLDVVVVRITCGDTMKVTKSLSEIMDDVFDDAVCLKTQMEGCSNDKVKIAGTQKRWNRCHRLCVCLTRQNS